MVADIEELETMDASEIYSKRLNAKEVIFPKENANFIFPAADGRIKFVGGDQELRTSTLIRDHPIRGEGKRDFLGESQGSPLSPPQDSYPDAGEAINDFWSMSGNFIYREHFEHRVKLHSLTSPELYIRTWMLCKKATSMTIGISMGQEICLILGQVSLKFTLSCEKPPNGYVVRVEINEKTADIQVRSFVARTLERINKKC